VEAITMNLEQKTLFITGKFDDNGGRESKIGNILFKGMDLTDTINCEYHNGGSFAELETIVDRVQEYNTIYWFPDITNDKVKLVKKIKEKNNACVLVTSKRNTEGKYSFADLVHHALGNKSNLFVEITEEGGRYQGRVIDPLGNVFLDHNTDFTLVGKVVAKRANELSRYTRIGSRQIGERKNIPTDNDFFQVIKEYGETFHNLIHAHPDAVNRFFGNASFRCERGFPSFKEGNLIYVSQRNIDKRSISSDGFVALDTTIPVQYYGDRKPSVDSPIQVALYNYYPNVKYMLHGHAYVQGAPFTKNVVLCGALEEAEEIIALFPNPETVNVAVNLKGHGSLLMVNDVRELENIPYVARPTPDIHDDYVQRVRP